MVNKNKRAKTQAPAKAAGSPLWNHRLFPPVFFLALSLLYFYEFPLSDKIVYGMDVGTDYHKGAALSFWDKVQTVAQPMWDPKMGGFPQSEAIRPQYFPAYVLYFFTSFQRYIGWRYILTMFAAGLGYVRVLAANPRGRSRRAVGRSSVHVRADLFGVPLGRPLRQDGRHRPVPVDYLGVGKGSGAGAADLLGGARRADWRVYLLPSADDVLRAAGSGRLFPI